MSWSNLQKWAEEGAIPYIDYALAQQIAKGKEEAVAAVVAFLAAAMRSGHLCCRVVRESLVPNPAQLWERVPQGLVSLIERGVDRLPNLPHIHRWQEKLYFARFWQQESLLIEAAERFLKSTVTVLTQEVTGTASLTDEQRTAVLSAASQPLTLISGGPGTGKTHAAGHLARLLWEQCPSVALAAPTGKAALRLQQSMARALPELTTVQATTLHSLLKNGRTTQLAADLLIVDEGSMIDLPMMAALFAALKPGARLVILGDHNQLPPVEIGAPFADLVAALPSSELTRCQRTDLQPMIDFAALVKAGLAEEALSLLGDGPLCRPSRGGNPWELRQRLLADLVPLFPKATELDPAAFDRFRLLSPVRAGPLGVEALNQLFFNHFRQNVPEGVPFASPIVVVRNDWRQQLFNGEVGVLVSFGKEGLQAGDYALFSGRKIPALLLPPFEYGYCLSVHKSQGSEFDAVAVVLPEGSCRFGRQLLYTAVTRARSQVQIWGSDETLVQMIGRGSERLSSVVERIRV